MCCFPVPWNTSRSNQSLLKLFGRRGWPIAFFSLPLQWEASRSCSQSGQCDMCSEWNENIGHCHLLVGLSQYQQNEVQWCISSFFLFLFLEHLCALKPHARICICVITSQSEEEHCWPSMFLCWTFYGAEEQDWGAVINSLHVPLHKWNGIETQVQPEMKAKWDRLPFIWKGVCLNEGNAPLKIQSK